MSIASGRGNISLATHCLIYVPMSGVVGAIASWRLSPAEFEVAIAFVVGAIAGFALSPLTHLATRHRHMLASMSCIYGPTIVVALVASNPYSPMMSFVCSVMAYLLSVGLCLSIVPGLRDSGYASESPRFHWDVLRYGWAMVMVLGIGFILVHGMRAIPNLPTANDSVLLDFMASDDMQLQAEAAREMARRSRESLEVAMADGRPQVRRNAVRALGLRKDPWADELLDDMLKDEAQFVRDEAANWIERRKGKE